MRLVQRVEYGAPWFDHALRMLHRLQRLHKKLVWHWAVRSLKRLGRSPLTPAIAERLIYGWDNPVWSAEAIYLCECHASALKSPGPILECGSGLSTIVLAAAAHAQHHTLISLEHHQSWQQRVSNELRRLQLSNATVVFAPLRSYGAFDWYDTGAVCIPNDIGLVVCDGPPGKTRGGRYGMLPLMGDYLHRPCVILLDDYGRNEEKDIATAWLSLRQGHLVSGQSQRGYARIELK
jgi:hypothetical protein